MTEKNKKWFYQILEKCEYSFGDRMVDGRTINVIGAFENDTIEEFVGSKERDLFAMSILCTIKELLSQESPDMNRVSQMFEKVCNIMHLSRQDG